ncbi:MAG TPA: multiheme c-type cytochrome, partial [Myxococcota bacterium]
MPRLPVATAALLASTALASCAAAQTAAPSPSPPASSALVPTAAASPPDAPDAPHAPIFAPPGPGKRALILFTASVQGYVEPCGCTGDPLGGVARLAAAVDDARSTWGARVLLLDGGDLFFEHSDDNAAADACQAGARADLLLSTYARLGLAATALGALDDVRGPAWRDARLDKNDVLTVGVDPARSLVSGAKHSSSFIRDVGGAKIGVTAFSADDKAGESAAHDALAAEVQRLHKDADAIVVIAQSARDASKRVVAGIPGIDVVIQGRAPGEVPIPPEKLDSGAVLVAAGMQAQYLGVVELALDGRQPGAALVLDDAQAQGDARKKILDVRIHELEGQVSSSPEGARRQFLAQRLDAAKAERTAIDDTTAKQAPLAAPGLRMTALPLPRGFPEDGAAKRALAHYSDSIPSLVASCEANLTCPAPKPSEPTYVGASTCMKCHAGPYKFWQAQTVTLPGKDRAGHSIMRVEGHVHAWETLTADGKDSDRECVGCHSVGFGSAAGACKTGDVVARGLAAVQCESCHGPGSAHAKS